MRLEGKVAVITGSATGIGRACAKRMATEGAAVVIDFTEGQQEKAKQLVAEIERDGGRATAVSANVCERNDVQHLVDTAVKTFARVDVIVNNAGIEQEKPFIDMPDDVWHAVLDVNFTGPFLCSQIAARQMIAQGGGRIINISSPIARLKAAYAC